MMIDYVSSPDVDFGDVRSCIMWLATMVGGQGCTRQPGWLG